MGLEQVRSLTKRPGYGLDYERVIAAQAKALPALYAQKEEEKQRKAELDLGKEKLALEKEGLEAQKSYLAGLSTTQAEAQEIAEQQQTRSNILGGAQLGLSAYNTLKTGERAKKIGDIISKVGKKPKEITSSPSPNDLNNPEAFGEGAPAPAGSAAEPAIGDVTLTGVSEAELAPVAGEGTAVFGNMSGTAPEALTGITAATPMSEFGVQNLLNFGAEDIAVYGEEAIPASFGAIPEGASYGVEGLAGNTAISGEAVGEYGAELGLGETAGMSSGGALAAIAALEMFATAAGHKEYGPITATTTNLEEWGNWIEENITDPAGEWLEDRLGCIIVTVCTDADVYCLKISRLYRDIYMTRTQLRGYYMLAEKVVPYLQKYPWLKRFIKRNLVDKWVAYGEWKLNYKHKVPSFRSYATTKLFLGLCSTIGSLKAEFVRYNQEVI